MTPFRSKEEQAAAMAKGQARRGSPPSRVPLTKVAKGSPLPPDLLIRELRLGLEKLAGELFDLTVRHAMRILQDVPRHRLRGSLVEAYRITRDLCEKELIPKERATFLGYQALKCARRADCFEAISQAVELARPWPSPEYEQAFRDATDSVFVEVAQDLPIAEAIQASQALFEKDKSGASAEFRRIHEAAYAAIKKAYARAGRPFKPRREGGSDAV